MSLLVFYPNSYSGADKIVNIINAQKKNNKNIHVIKNLSHEEYVSLLKHSLAMVGNSSSGIVEAASLKVGVVDIGNRQKFRETPTNVIRANFNEQEIQRSVKKVLYDKNFQKSVKNAKSPYGSGKASKKIVKLLKNIKINNNLLKKKFI